VIFALRPCFFPVNAKPLNAEAAKDAESAENTSSKHDASGDETRLEMSGCGIRRAHRARELPNEQKSSPILPRWLESD
jgi:hypothetical protein